MFIIEGNDIFYLEVSQNKDVFFSILVHRYPWILSFASLS